jgi:ABC-type transport system involved in multi-copper enzyme maturation permease subunit
MSIAPPSLRLDIHIIWTLAKRQALNGLRAPSTYIVASLVAIVQAVILTAPLDYLSEFGLYVSNNPLIPAFLGGIAVISTYVAITAAISLVQERENQTLRVLFYTPVDHNSLILGKYCAQILNSLVVLSIAVLYLIIIAILTNLSVGTQLAWAVVLCIMLVSSMVAFGLTISAISNSIRTSLMLLFGLLILLFGLQIASRVINQILPGQGSSTLIFVNPLLDALTAFITLFSPLTYLLKGLEAAAIASGRDFIINLGASLVYTATFLVLATWISKRRGVIP